MFCTRRRIRIGNCAAPDTDYHADVGQVSANLWITADEVSVTHRCEPDT
jgi:hypothetical protein